MHSPCQFITLCPFFCLSNVSTLMYPPLQIDRSWLLWISRSLQSNRPWRPKRRGKKDEEAAEKESVKSRLYQ